MTTYGICQESPHFWCIFFTEYKILGWHYFSFSIKKYHFPCLSASMISDKESATVFTVVSLCHDSSYSSYLQDFVFVLCYQQFVYGGFCVFQKNFVLCMICVCVCDFYISILISVPFTLQKLLPIFPQVLVSALLFFISFWDSNDLLRILVLTYRPWKLYLIFKNIFLFVLQLVLTSIEMYIYIYIYLYIHIYIYMRLRWFRTKRHTSCNPSSTN